MLGTIPGGDPHLSDSANLILVPLELVVSAWLLYFIWWGIWGHNRPNGHTMFDRRIAAMNRNYELRKAQQAMQPQQHRSDVLVARAAEKWNALPADRGVRRLAGQLWFAAVIVGFVLLGLLILGWAISNGSCVVNGDYSTCAP